jgi:hypothetical protein
MKTYRVAVIGHTGKGNYGHGVDTVWLKVPQCEIVAVADADEKGLAAAAARLKAPKTFADYRTMLTEVKPDIVGHWPPLARSTSRHVPRLGRHWRAHVYGKTLLPHTGRSR